MKKGTLLVLILLAVYGYAYCEDIAYTVTQNLRLLRNDSGRTAGGVAVTDGETVFFQGKITDATTRDGFIDLILVRTEQGQEGWIDTRYVLLKDNQPLPVSVAAKFWIPSYYQQFLCGAEKERLFDFEPSWRDEYYEDTKNWGYPEPWWFNAGNTRYLIHNNLISIYGVYVQDYIQLLTENQQYNLDTITISVICLRKLNFTPNSSLNRLFSEGERYILTLRIDGDYMDIYVNDEKEKIATLVGVDEYFQKSIGNFFMGETVDLSLITWPRRADGSMDDYPQPAGVSTAPSVTEEEPGYVELSIESANTENSRTTQNSTKASAMSLWALFAIIGGVVVVGGVVVFVVRRRK